ncbi:ABC transporter permease [Pseudorhizobium endolithicum]|uniref:ABC transporter permease n=1 Tax=Pseudorhizobium endolithicum TaxID=1191678 RepID=A0ABM8PSA7_9HYPH|nr:ABC transporter permease [Pseudorhizobium endolithicum]CAD6414096.1 ABC transporter permease [Rhizobium sp. Q54]CAD7045561.1 ABC transporter permease [Pseudorhizobium endolithicum]
MSGWFSALATALDPLCGQVGIFTLLGGDGLVSCGAGGWGDEIAFGVKVTITLAVATLPFGLLLGFLIALAAQSEDKLLRAAVGVYTTIFRGLPELLTLFIVYYGLQLLLQSILGWMGVEQRIEINAFLAGMIALAVVFSSYASEVLLSAFRAIPRGQYEAGDALGLHRSRTMILLILPQLIRIALPGLGNLWMILLKDTAYVSIIGLSDIVRQTSVAARVSKEAFFFYFLACLLYLVLAILSSFGLSFIERWSRRGEARR